MGGGGGGGQGNVRGYLIRIFNPIKIYEYNVN